MGFLQSIYTYLHLSASIADATKGIVNALERRVYCFLKKEALHGYSVETTRKGVSHDVIADNPVIVSLTTHGKRLYEVYLTIESIMQGTVLPNKIILWLSEEYKNSPLPITLRNQMKRGLEVRYCRDVRSYTKLIPALREFPDSVIITIDDDVFYQPDMLEGLLNAHAIYPNDVLANRVDEIVLGSDGKPITCLNWNIFQKPKGVSPLNLALGVEGVLYPPNSFDEEVLNEQVFLSICPTADDLCFKAMELRAGTNVRHVYTHYERGGEIIPNIGTQDIGLQYINENVNDCKNDSQFAKVLDRYNLYGKLKKIDGLG